MPKLCSIVNCGSKYLGGGLSQRKLFGVPKRNEPLDIPNEMDTSDCPEKSDPTDPLLRISRERMDEIIRSYQFVKQTALHGENRVPENPTISSDLASQVGRSNENGCNAKKSRSNYDPQLMMFKRMICSDDLTTDRLIPRNENIPLPVDKSTIEKQEDEDFFERLKKRIISDIQNKVLNGPEPPSSKRSSTIKKRKSPFSNECLNLMKKCRSHLVEGSSEAASSTMDNGFFSLMANELDRGNQENFDSHQTTTQAITISVERTSMTVPLEKIETPSNDVRYSEVDSDFICSTPLFIVKKMDVETENTN